MPCIHTKVGWIQSYFFSYQNILAAFLMPQSCGQELLHLHLLCPAQKPLTCYQIHKGWILNRSALRRAHLFLQLPVGSKSATYTTMITSSSLMCFPYKDGSAKVFSNPMDCRTLSTNVFQSQEAWHKPTNRIVLSIEDRHGPHVPARQSPQVGCGTVLYLTKRWRKQS